LKIKEKIKLEEICVAGVLAKDYKPRDLVSQMVVTEKKAGDWRIFLDPGRLSDLL